MGLVPDSKSGKIQFYTSKIAPWTANAVTIGTTSAAVTDLNTKLTTASTKLAAQQAAAEAAKTATLAANNAVDALAIAGSNIILAIRAKAAVTGDSVYELAEIPPPATPSPVGPPGTPYEFGVELNQNGSLEINWKCDNPAGSGGTMYQVFRRTTATGEFEYIGGTGAKKFLDATIPAGSSQVTYQLQAVRSTQAGEWAQFNVNFGVAGETTITVQTPTKIAA